MVREFQAVIGREAREQMLEAEGRLPGYCVACVGGGSNSIGIFSGFMDDPEVRLVGVEPGGRGLEYGQHAATLCLGEPGVMHGFKSYMLKDPKGEPAEVASCSAGLDYPGVGPEHAHLKDVTSSSALQAAADDDPAPNPTEVSPVGIDSSGQSLTWQPNDTWCSARR